MDQCVIGVTVVRREELKNVFGVKSLSLTLESTGNRAFQPARKNEDRKKIVPSNGNGVKLNRGSCLIIVWRKWRVNISRSIKPSYQKIRNHRPKAPFSRREIYWPIKVVKPSSPHHLDLLLIQPNLPSISPKHTLTCWSPQKESLA